MLSWHGRRWLHWRAKILFGKGHARWEALGGYFIVIVVVRRHGQLHKRLVFMCLYMARGADDRGTVNIHSRRRRSSWFLHHLLPRRRHRYSQEVVQELVFYLLLYLCLFNVFFSKFDRVLYSCFSSPFEHDFTSLSKEVFAEFDLDVLLLNC